MKVAWHLKKSNFVIGHIWLVLFSEGMGRALKIRLYFCNQQNIQRTQFLQLEEFRSKWTKIVAASNPFALIKNKHKFRFLLKISWLLEMHFSTRDACCTLYCWRMVKPLFYRLYEEETVDLRVWIPFMTCLGWWAGTTVPPRIPPNQGCKHLSVMSFIHLQWWSEMRTCLIYLWCFEKYYTLALLKVYCKKYELLLSLPFYICFRYLL